MRWSSLVAHATDSVVAVRYLDDMRTAATQKRGLELHDGEPVTERRAGLEPGRARGPSAPAFSQAGQMSHQPVHGDEPQAYLWFSPGVDQSAAVAMGMRLVGGGGHQSKTMMLVELALYLEVARSHDPDGARMLVFQENLLGKNSESARRSALTNLNKLYALNRMPAISRAMVAIWGADQPGQPIVALLCALARDPLLRDTADAILQAQPGDKLRWPSLAAEISRKHPDRFSPAMLKSLSQNCASTWTQSGHLTGRLNKVRRRAHATPEAAAFAVFLARIAGFGGPALVDSPWLGVLDVPREERLALLRRAQGRGLVRMREAGAVLEIEPAGELAMDNA